MPARPILAAAANCACGEERPGSASSGCMPLATVVATAAAAAAAAAMEGVGGVDAWATGEICGGATGDGGAT